MKREESKNALIGWFKFYVALGIIILLLLGFNNCESNSSSENKGIEYEEGDFDMAPVQKE